MEQMPNYQTNVKTYWVKNEEEMGKQNETKGLIISIARE